MFVSSDTAHRLGASLGGAEGP
ncbi:protein of unknown function [Azospirillum baldaniorum]|uniref:Uncharacterized protein n=1 Tax=Azospirillum baldaniorum TaxID=1064539 RepID=A0A9P1NNB4_9PROT|nr:protein of unknown function [Azospirillum baldaniorum]